MLEIKNLACGYKNILLRDLSFKADKGDFVCILGSNGSGKSTLIKTIVGLLPAQAGHILINEENIKDWTWPKRARTIAYIPQHFNSTFPYKGGEIVLMGRTSYLNFGARPQKEDLDIAREAMDRLNILHLENKIYSKMSGGERQLVKIAQALSQKAKILVMDEPTNNLDFGNQITMIKHLEKCLDLGLLVIMATHFPDQALRYGSKAILLKDGESRIIKKPQENLKAEDLENLYGVKIELIEISNEDRRRKLCLTN